MALSLAARFIWLAAIARCDSIRIASVPPAVALPVARLVLHSCFIPRLCQRGWSFWMSFSGGNGVKLFITSSSIVF